MSFGTTLETPPLAGFFIYIKDANSPCRDTLPTEKEVFMEDVSLKNYLQREYGEESGEALRVYEKLIKQLVDCRIPIVVFVFNVWESFAERNLKYRGDIRKGSWKERAVAAQLEPKGLCADLEGHCWIESSQYRMVGSGTISSVREEYPCFPFVALAKYFLARELDMAEKYRLSPEEVPRALLGIGALLYLSQKK